MIVGTHLPFWPLYILWCAGLQSLPTSLLTMTFTPLFLLIPALSRRNARASRIAMPLFGIANAIFTTWILGVASGSELFLVPCAALSSMTFRHTERWLMTGLTALPLVVWYIMLGHAPTPLHRYGPAALHQLFILNTVSAGILLIIFGWFRLAIYRRMEAR
ncbi:MAG: hypothetical protein B7Z58_09785 [Acidiphilium sp. 37-64-53]|uniref:hypothetical protein n=1 Tax=Acidiphilium TaxID=522 RepID=UPI000BC63C3B|nr:MULTISPECIES: hypothetical protein [unclassified Acidiphilium]OYV62989.1 MAG: hypothetical protein B7X01_00775 [Acidiphilium sp. 21-62-4]OYW01920.1 MAG: hypothetical protein B7Z58_09785 [Acidiphilium sp. 37-64-53]OZB29810.1 MAG: hypothetical protein B7X49_05545 [Acidiphilium sp. 34-64-41]HQT84445.1 hypothetical protein [Acidiphilium rubrum]